MDKCDLYLCMFISPPSCCVLLNHVPIRDKDTSIDIQHLWFI